MQVALVQRILPPYRLGPLDAVAREIGRRHPGARLCVYHGDADPGAVRDSSDFESIRVPSWGRRVIWQRLGAIGPLVDVDLVVSEFSLRLLSSVWLLVRCRLAGVPFLWWGSGCEEWNEAGDRPMNRLRRAIRRRLVRAADGMVVYGDQARDYYLGLGARWAVTAPNTIDTTVVDHALGAMPTGTCRATREHLGIDPDARVLLFVGRLHSRKQVDGLLWALAELGRSRTDLAAVVVGDGPGRETLEALANQLGPGQVVFTGAITDPYQLSAIYAASDVAFFPGQAGLGVVSAMAHGVPVVVATGEGPELEALVDGVAGFRADPDSGVSPHEALACLLDDPALSAALGRGARDMATSYRSVRRMAHGFVDALDRAAAPASPVAIEGTPVEVAVLGPTPPPVHGVAVMFETVLTQLDADPRLDLRHVEVGDPAKGRNFGVFTWNNARAALVDVARGGYTLMIRRPAVAYLSLSQNRWAFLRDSLLVVAARCAGASVVVHLHGAHFGRFRRDSNPVLRRFIDGVLGSVDRAIVLGEGLRHLLGPSFPAERVRVVPNGIDLPEHVASKSGPSEFRVLFMGVLDETKGFVELIRAWPAVRDRLPGARLTCAGRWESDSLRHRVASEIDDLGLQGAVEFPGVVTGEAKSRLLHEVDAFCLPTHYSLEGLPVVILEAMAAGLPVVSTPRGAIAEIVEEGGSGFLVPEHDGVALAERLLRLGVDQELRSSMGRRGKELHGLRYTADRFASRIADILLEATTA